MKKVYAISIMLSLILAAGCATGPLQMNRAMVMPAQIAAGDNATIMVTFKGPKDQVASVHAVVRENPDITYDLNDNGENGDQMANDNIWSYVTQVPYEATPGTYHLDITAKDQDGKKVAGESVQSMSDGIVTVEVTVR